MITSKTVALGFAAVLISAVSAQAAPHHKKPAHRAASTMHHGKTMAHSPRAARGTAGNADMSADSLNAQSLSRAQGVTQ